VCRTLIPCPAPTVSNGFRVIKIQEGCAFFLMKKIFVPPPNSMASVAENKEQHSQEVLQRQTCR
jgi:hypothetical protein